MLSQNSTYTFMRFFNIFWMSFQIVAKVPKMKYIALFEPKFNIEHGIVAEKG